MKFFKIFLVIFVILTVFTAFSIMMLLKSNKTSETTPTFPPQNQPVEKQLPTIIIDAGHGGEDGGAIGKNGAYEKDINLILAKKLKDRLDAQNIPCVLTRSEDILLYDKSADFKGKKKKLDLQARKEFAEGYENAIFISIHQNSFSKSQYSGLQVYYSTNDPASRILASKIQADIKKGLQPNNNRAIKPSSSIYLLDELTCPAVLVECGFLSNEVECERLCDESYQNALCDIMCEVIAEFVK